MGLGVSHSLAPMCSFHVDVRTYPSGNVGVESQMLTGDVFLNGSPPYYLRQGLSLNL